MLPTDSIAEIMRHVEHRPIPMPRGPWIMTQVWHDLLFAHWREDPAVVLAMLPPQLELETFDGAAWLGVIPFTMSDIRLRGMPAIPHISHSPELNVRTYVRYNGIPGVYFFSLDLARVVGVWGARVGYALNYFWAKMRVRREGGKIHYWSHRRSLPGAPKLREANFEATYWPVGDARHSQPGTIEHFVTERYCLYAVSSIGTVLRGNIHHLPWPLQSAGAEIRTNIISAPPGEPLLHYAKRMRVLIWPPEGG